MVHWSKLGVVGVDKKKVLRAWKILFYITVILCLVDDYEWFDGMTGTLTDIDDDFITPGGQYYLIIP